MIEYQEIFLNKMKLPLPYFVKFFENDIIILKNNQDNCIIEKLD